MCSMQIFIVYFIFISRERDANKINNEKIETLFHYLFNTQQLK